MQKIGRNAPRAELKDYREAVAKAIAWLGDRYLLAHPVNVSAGVRAIPRWLASGTEIRGCGMPAAGHVDVQCGAQWEERR